MFNMHEHDESLIFYQYSLRSLSHFHLLLTHVVY